MTAPIRPEHMMLAANRVPMQWIEPVAQLLADTEAAKDAEIARLKAERDELVASLDALESTIDDNLPEVTCDSDGNPETFPGLRVEIVGQLFSEQEKSLAALSAEYADAVRALAGLDDYFDQRADADAVGDPQRYVGNTEMHRLADIRRITSTPRARAVLEQGETT